jgi:hypothetical protein
MSPRMKKRKRIQIGVAILRILMIRNGPAAMMPTEDLVTQVVPAAVLPRAVVLSTKDCPQLVPH